MVREDTRMPVPPEVFDEDYLYFYDELLTAERADADAEVVAGLLELEPGARVLDVPCGTGRIAGRLAARGCEVVGVDITDRFLELGRERFPDVRFERRDIRELEYEDEFDAVVNWFTSWGYFDPATNDAVLRGFARALRPGGRLVLELHNPERLRRILDLAGGVTWTGAERDGELMIDRIRLDESRRESHTERFVVRGGRVRKLEFTLEQVPAVELEARLGQAGFESVRLFGAGGGEYLPEGPRLIAVATR
jgi:SAM-dependent methyltransferase